LRQLDGARLREHHQGRCKVKLLAR
jgi:hypothetical protein